MTWTLTTTLADYHYRGDVGGKPVQVAFTNDALGRDAFVDYLQIGDTRWQAEDQAVNTAAWENGSCGGDYSEWMQCAGHITFELGVTNARREADAFLPKEPSPEPPFSVSVYPNPLRTGSFTVSLPSNVQNGTLSLRTLAGREVLRRTFTSSRLTMSPPPLPAGSYLLRVVAAGRTHSQTIIIP